MEIQLTQGKVAFIDDEDFHLISSRKWAYHIDKKNSSNEYAVSSYYEDSKVKAYRMHRVILGISNPKILIDHIDGNGLNNRRLNLRICTPQQNCRNHKSKNKNSNHLFKGVSNVSYKSNSIVKKPFRAHITIDNRYIHLGCFVTQEEAAKSYDLNALKYFGDYACLNFKEDKMIYLQILDELAIKRNGVSNNQ